MKKLLISVIFIAGLISLNNSSAFNSPLENQIDDMYAQIYATIWHNEKTLSSDELQFFLNLSFLTTLFTEVGTAPTELIDSTAQTALRLRAEEGMDYVIDGTVPWNNNNGKIAIQNAHTFGVTEKLFNVLCTMTYLEKYSQLLPWINEIQKNVTAIISTFYQQEKETITSAVQEHLEQLRKISDGLSESCTDMSYVVDDAAQSKNNDFITRIDGIKPHLGSLHTKIADLHENICNLEAFFSTRAMQLAKLSFALYYTALYNGMKLREVDQSCFEPLFNIADLEQVNPDFSERFSSLFKNNQLPKPQDAFSGLMDSCLELL